MIGDSVIRDHLTFLYGSPLAESLWPQLQARLEAFREKHPHLRTISPPDDRLTERDAIIIIYADQFRSPEHTPLQTLMQFTEDHLGEAISGIHLLPFFPYSSDDGFSVIDYREVDPNAGDWADIARLGSKYRLMFDAVINHISRQSIWFQGYIQGEGPYNRYFIEESPDTDLSKVVRPRALPLLTPVETTRGVKHIWTTFSDDQIDLNYANPQVLLEMIDVLLFYVARGAEIIRLDAIAYLWKEVGTTCIHLPQTHRVVKLWRAVLDAVAPNIILITETNVPHEENISYFGDGEDEAQMVYQFPLAPLVLHTFLTGDASKLTVWASSLETPSPATTFFNFIASHDGIGVRPAEGLLTPEEVQALVDQTLQHGGAVSYKDNPDGSRSVYELNITLYDWLNNPDNPQPKKDVRQFLASQAIMLSLAGVPGIYVHSLFGSRNCQACFAETGRARSINREKFIYPALADRLADSGSHPSKVLSGYRQLLHQRCKHRAFHPNASQKVLKINEGVFSLLRGAPDEGETILSFINVTNRPTQLEVDLSNFGLPFDSKWSDILGRGEFDSVNGYLHISLDAYQILWLAN